MIGPSADGRYFYIALRPVSDAGVWYPVTGWRMARRLALRLYNTGRQAVASNGN